MLNEETKHGFIKLNNYNLHYIQWGAGSHVVLAFHGYAQNASVFSFLEHKDYTVLSFDLPFQGTTQHTQKALSFSNEDLKLIYQYCVDHFKALKISLVGFSLGARVCLAMLCLLPKQVSAMVLIAPDGIKAKYFFSFLTNSAIGRFCFRGFVKWGAVYLKLFTLLRNIGLMNRNMYMFALQHIRTPEAREKLYHIWCSLGALKSSRPLILQHLKSNHIQLHLLMGQQDPIIPVKSAMTFKGKHKNIVVHVFDRAHNLLAFEEVKGTVCAWLYHNIYN